MEVLYQVPYSPPLQLGTIDTKITRILHQWGAAQSFTKVETSISQSFSGLPDSVSYYTPQVLETDIDRKFHLQTYQCQPRIFHLVHWSA